MANAICKCILTQPYHVDEDINIDQRFLSINSHSSIRQPITFERYVRTIAGVEYRTLYGFNMKYNCGLNFSGVKLVVPALDGSWPNFSSVRETLISWPSSSTFGSSSIAIGFSDLDIPTNPFGALLANSVPMQLWVGSIVLTGAASSILGRLIRTVTNTSGTAIPPYLTTNLTQI